jgi:hypothetical protein
MHRHTNTKNILIYQTKNVNLFFSQKPTDLQPHTHYIKHSTPIILNIPHHIKHSELPLHNKDGIKIRKEQQN